MESQGECVFCQIIGGEKPAKKRYEDGDFVVFDDIKPSAPVHVLVVPRLHATDLNDERVSDELAGKMINLTRKLAKEWGLSSFRVQVNNGRQAGQIVFHLHMHLMGWEKKEGGVF